MFNVLFEKIDKLICIYLGLEVHDIEKPKTIRLSQNKLILYKNHLFQRHRYQERIERIEYIPTYPDELNTKIGIAAGNVIAKNLMISFKKVEIKKCQ